MRTAKLGAVAKLDYGFAFDSQQFNTDGRGLPLVRIRDVVRGRSDTYYSGTYADRYLVRDGDYLIGMDGQFNLARWRGGKALLNQRVCRIGDLDASLDRAYLARFMPLALKAIEDATPFVTVKHLSAKALNTIDVPLPSPPEQRRIAAILDHADALRAQRRQVLTHLDALTQSIFQSTIAVTSWPVEKLGERLEFLTSGSRGWAKYYAPSGAKFIRIQNVNSGYLNLDDMAYVAAPPTAEATRTAVREGDVLLSITADLGRTAVVPNGIGVAHINQHLAILRAPSLDPRYLADFLSSPVGQREVLGKDRGATKAGLNFDDVRSVAVPIPPKEIQRIYGSRVARINAQRAAVERAIAADEGLFASLQSRAFDGRCD